MNLLGTSIISGSRGSSTGDRFFAFDPRTGEPVEPAFFPASQDDLEQAVLGAARSSLKYRSASGAKKAEFLRRIAANLEAAKADIVARCSIETAYASARVESELARTCFQLRLFAELVEDGSWVDARIDHGDAERKPLPKPDVRSMLRPLGPVAVFCASNFPLAFSVAGGDTASALATGCPVVVVVNPAHPGTAEIAGVAISDAVKDCGLPSGVFSLLFASDYEIGSKLAAHPEIKAVGFTGSRAGGTALVKIAAERSEPIPVYAEMGSINPVFVLPRCFAQRRGEIVQGLFASFTLGWGQFCTKPGTVAIIGPDAAEDLVQSLTSLVLDTEPTALLSERIQSKFVDGVSARASLLNKVERAAGAQGFAARASVFNANADEFRSNGDLACEVFGPTTLVVTADGRDQLLDVARSLEGQLTATVWGTDEDLAEFRELIEILETKAGRIILNGFPTGVEVGYAMVHGGPFPATSDSRSTSVGTRAIERFCRPVCYQNVPDEHLPAELRESNPLGIRRMVDGKIVLPA